MRSPNKNRSRNKNGRKSVGNVVNRVFDSAGPDGKVRGTPSQIIEKYTTLSRDAQTSGDRVNAENFMQHAEHYTRLLSEAMRENAARQQDMAQQQGQQQNNNQHHQPGGGGPQPIVATPDVEEQAAGGLQTIEQAAPDSGGLVTTPESGNAADAAPPKRSRNTRRRKPQVQAETTEIAEAPSDVVEVPAVPQA